MRGWFWLFVLLTGCHFGWSAFGGAPPRTNKAIKLGLYTPDAPSSVLAHQVLAKDPNVTVVDFAPATTGPSTNPPATTAPVTSPPETNPPAPATNPPAPAAEAASQPTLEAGCQWARSQQLDYYAIGSASARYTAEYVCTAHAGSILDKTEGQCTDGYYKNQQSAATFSLDVYDIATCQKIGPLSQQVTTYAPGEEAESKPAALTQLDRDVPARAHGFPDQINIETNGRVNAPSGYYALYRGERFRGFIALEDGDVRPLHCCDTPSPGDRLVGRGKRKLLELAINGVVGSFTFDGKRRFGGGAGVHVRYYPLDSGFRFGFGMDSIGNPYAAAQTLIFTPEIGWGFRPSSAFSLSVNAGLGWMGAQQVVESMNDAAPTALAAHGMLNLRAVTFFAKWWYLGADVGYIYSSAIDNWEGDGAAGAKNMTIRSPLARLWLGFDL